MNIISADTAREQTKYKLEKLKKEYESEIKSLENQITDSIQFAIDEGLNSTFLNVSAENPIWMRNAVLKKLINLGYDAHYSAKMTTIKYLLLTIRW